MDALTHLRQIKCVSSRHYFFDAKCDGSPLTQMFVTSLCQDFPWQSGDGPWLILGSGSGGHVAMGKYLQQQDGTTHKPGDTQDVKDTLKVL